MRIACAGPEPGIRDPIPLDPVKLAGLGFVQSEYESTLQMMVSNIQPDRVQARLREDQARWQEACLRLSQEAEEEKVKKRKIEYLGAWDILTFEVHDPATFPPGVALSHVSSL